ncbi:phosphoglycolate phosphatase [Paracoccus ravus]|uniref:phosphoglycolate phosphatase n=1 Tax=Paracoccus ravus TaxID=2447760 RepID=UPI00106EDAB5|nr:phosphoglycolate phosphatase [Paracoccus ravus]
MNTCLAPCPVVFDLDGTLIDSAPDIHATVNAVLRLHGVAPLSLDTVRSFIGGGVDMLWRRVVSAAGLPVEAHRELVASFMVRYHDATSLTRIFPNAVAALGVLADRGHGLGICTNKPLGPTRAILEHFGIASLFHVIIGGDSLPQRKPDAAPLHAAFLGLGADPRQPRGFFVGDSEFDAECAVNAGVPFLLFSGGYRKAGLEELNSLAHFDDHSELPGLIENAAALART